MSLHRSLYRLSACRPVPAEPSLPRAWPRVAAAGALLATLAAAAPAALAQAAAPAIDMRAAAYLAANCANCHGTSGRSTGAMPALAGVPAANIERAMRDFRDGKRSATLMHQLAKGYTDEQIAAMAAYFAAQKVTP
jgi:cytochrome subunit of sulfide dehydrogenase